MDDDFQQVIASMDEDELRDCLRSLVGSLNNNDLEDAQDVLLCWGLLREEE